MKQKIALFVSVFVLFVVSVSCTGITTKASSPTPFPATLVNGIQIEPGSDNNIRIVDHDNGYAFLLSKDWLPVQNDFKTIKDQANALTKNDPQIAELLEKRLNSSFFRVIAFNQNENYRNKMIVTNLIVFIDTYFPSLSLDKAVKQFAGGATSTMSANKNNVEYGFISAETKVEIEGTPVNIHRDVFLVQLKTGHVFFMMDMPSSLDEKSKVLSRELIDSVSLLDE